MRWKTLGVTIIKMSSNQQNLTDNQYKQDKKYSDAQGLSSGSNQQNMKDNQNQQKDSKNPMSDDKHTTDFDKGHRNQNQPIGQNTHVKDMKSN